MFPLGNKEKEKIKKEKKKRMSFFFFFLDSFAYSGAKIIDSIFVYVIMKFLSLFQLESIGHQLFILKYE